LLRALIENENQEQALRLDLFDAGSGSDNVANDGIYSRYFTKYDGNNGRYTLRCQVKGNDDTNFITEKEGAIKLANLDHTRILERSYPLKPVAGSSPVCCGSSTGENVATKPTGNFTRQAGGVSFKVCFF
jgi:hypothetical protein